MTHKLPEPQIENPNALELTWPPNMQAILKRMFAGYQKVEIKAEFGGGFTNTRVFLVQPSKKRKTLLPCVVKVGPIELMQEEWYAYKSNDIHEGVPEIAHIWDFCLPEEWEYGGLRYPLVGYGLFQIKSWHRFYDDKQVRLKDLWYVLEKRLFRCLQPIWEWSSIESDFYYWGSYDTLLPINLYIQPTSPTDDKHLRHFDAAQIANGQQPPQLQKGDEVCLEGFVIIEVKDNDVTLNLPFPNGAWPCSYRLRLSHSLEKRPSNRDVPIFPSLARGLPHRGHGSFRLEMWLTNFSVNP